MEAIILVAWIAIIVALAAVGGRCRRRCVGSRAGRPREPILGRHRLMWTTFLLRATELAQERSREAKRESRARELRRQPRAKGRRRPIRRIDPDERDALTDRLGRSADPRAPARRPPNADPTTGPTPHRARRSMSRRPSPRLPGMTDLKIGALCWNQYATWPQLLEAGIRAERLGYTSLWTWDHLYPIVGSHEGPDVRGLADPGRLGAAHGASAPRPDGRGQHVPQPGRGDQDGDHARPPVGRSGDAGHRRGLVRDRAHGLRPRVRRGTTRPTALAGRGAAGHPRHAARRDTERCRAALRDARGAQRPAAAPAAACPCSSAAAARRSPSSSWLATATPATSVAAWPRSRARRPSCVPTARRSGATRPRSSARPTSVSSSSATPRTRRAA